MRRGGVVALVAGLAMCGVADASARPMPNFSPGFQSEAAFYRIAFLPDGYPGRQEPDGSITPHPIYGTYVLDDYLKQWRQRPSRKLERGIRRVARASINRMDSFRETLAFWYDHPNLQTQRGWQTYYSALTQSYYAVSLARAAKALDSKALSRAASRVFDSLRIPVAKGGVLFRDRHGVSLAEVPQEPNSYILNGWLSTLWSLARYEELASSARDQRIAGRLRRQSVETVRRHLPLYDVRGIANSRYGLTGYGSFRVVLDGPAQIDSASLRVPGEGVYSIPRLFSASPWRNYLYEPKPGIVRLNLVLSLISAPKPNTLLLTSQTDEPTTATLEVRRAKYDPRLPAPRQGGWTPVAPLVIRPEDPTVSLAIDQRIAKTLVGATSFTKNAGADGVNVYHPIHVKRLLQVAAVTEEPKLRRMAKRWRGFMCRWASLDLYDGLYARVYPSVHQREPGIDAVSVEEIC